MTLIRGDEPQHWHDGAGKHRMTDPRTVPDWLPYMEADERNYLAHLQAHEESVSNPQRQESDPLTISALFDMIESNEVQNGKLRALIAAYRMERR